MHHAADRVIGLLQSEGIITQEGRELMGLNRRLRQVIEELPLVELHPAHQWDCEHCGEENFSRCVTVSDQDDGGEVCGYWLTAPCTVKCHSCGKEYVVMTYGDEEDGQ